ncbi:MAG: hypothetical protein JWQ71_889 [Pedosphaera sp.]|nr:hypothetical protein [Pedosphaera sp.]
METTASIKKHPIHVMLVAIPLGLWIFSLVCDLIHFFSGNSEWATVAYYTLAGGIITALLAAIPGFIDLLSITEPKLRRIGVSHMIINLVVVGLYVINFFLRHRNPVDISKVPVILSIIGVLLLSVSGWLGGELVHVYRVSVAEPRTIPPKP